ncbi:hypothetical protein MRB53_031630 [Persea americana]|uniref:Uncharacterized protein n=1 Tax=Persea americana TaxID=3435 RepID=A0ACC2KPP2_PERAE|nr:hypothetical protein MRB53_031630 [Persea americana]|eukprot:TRINITY_DN50107_c0_g1_i1.p1 TRINITY_DN50107_c0_g1~~TRINITY_DN50107_c0_g1_i1.p1  ORF type:complete len:103 (-),score=17.62 TRINITY_DN50107_c0_g1_i1:215-523(-)
MRYLSLAIILISFLRILPAKEALVVHTSKPRLSSNGPLDQPAYADNNKNAIGRRRSDGPPAHNGYDEWLSNKRGITPPTPHSSPFRSQFAPPSPPPMERYKP